MPPDSFAVLTSPHAGAESFDAAQAFEIRRVREPWLLPHPLMVRRINKMARDIGADFVVLDPAVLGQDSSCRTWSCYMGQR